MATEINFLGGSAFFSQNIPLLSASFTVRLMFNHTDGMWRFSVSSAGNTLLHGRPLSANASPTRAYKRSELSGGNFWCLRKRVTKEPVGYSNIGFDKDYGLFFLTTEEEEVFGL